MTEMERIIDIAPLKDQAWAAALGVTSSEVQEYKKFETDNVRVHKTLDCLEKASQRRNEDIASWLTNPIPGTDLEPIKLIQAGKWRAFEGAIRTQQVPASDLSPDELALRRRNDINWAIREIETVPED